MGGITLSNRYIGLLFLCFMTAILFVSENHTDVKAAVVVKEYEEDGRKIIEIEKEDSDALDTSVIQDALKSGAGKPLTLILKSGTYRIHYALKLFDNTHLIAKGAVIEQTDPRRGLLINAKYTNSPFGDGTGKYGNCKNITVEGGIWIGGIPNEMREKTEGFESGYSNFMFLHGKNIKIKDLEIRNNYNGHFIEFGGIDKAIVENCKLGCEGDYVGEENNEAIQIDNTYAKVNSPVGAPFDDTPSKNITVKNCEIVFARGIGSNHKGKAFYDNIVLEGNNISSTMAECINLYDCKKIKVKNNKLRVLHNTHSYLSIACRIGIGEDNNEKVKPSLKIEKNDMEGYLNGIKISDNKKNSNGYGNTVIKNNRIKAHSNKKNAIHIGTKIKFDKLIQSKNKIK